MGPSAIRYAGLRRSLREQGFTGKDWGNLPVPQPEDCSTEDERLRNIDCIAPVAASVMEKVAACLQAGRMPLVLGGDHSLSMGSVRGAAQIKRLGLIWVDAHADFNTPETTPSGNIHGMPLAALAGYGDHRLTRLLGTDRRAIDPANIVVVGVRQLDAGEKENLRQAGVKVLSMQHIDRSGMHSVMTRAIEIAGRDTQGIYLSMDMDALDPLYAPGVGTPVQGGLTYREAHLLCEMIAASGLLAGVDLVEVNPILDERNKTAALSVELILSVLGKRIW